MQTTEIDPNLICGEALTRDLCCVMGSSLQCSCSVYAYHGQCEHSIFVASLDLTHTPATVDLKTLPQKRKGGRPKAAAEPPRKRRALAKAKAKAVPLPTLPPVTTTWAPAPAPSPATEPALNITVVWEKPRQADTASPDMPQIFIPGTPAPDIDAAAARASERHIEHHKHHKQHKHRVAAHPPPTEDHVEGNASERLPLAPVQNTTWPVDGASEALEGLMLERHRLAEKLLNVSDTFQGQKRRHHGLVKALLVSEDALQNLRAACADHAEASSLVWRELNVTQTKLRRLHGRIRIAKDAARRLEGCVDEDEAAKHANRARWSAEAAMQRAEVEQRLGKLLGMRKRLKCTYNLDVRPHADPYRISPAQDVSAEQAWPRGTLVFYKSEQMEKQGAAAPMAAVILSFNESDQTYNLDIREHADCDRIRVRVVPKEVREVSEPGLTSAMI
ncbi:unnamed protein product, partial [Effrenium voratum]